MECHHEWSQNWASLFWYSSPSFTFIQKHFFPFFLNINETVLWESLICIPLSATVRFQKLSPVNLTEFQRLYCKWQTRDLYANQCGVFIVTISTKMFEQSVQMSALWFILENVNKSCFVAYVWCLGGLCNILETNPPLIVYILFRFLINVIFSRTSMTTCWKWC